MIPIDTLNQRLAEAFGRPNGVDGRFKWLNAKDIPYFYRDQPHESWQRRTWADRIGPVWVLCQWRPPETSIAGIRCELTRQQWSEMFGLTRPFPEKGEFKPLCETAMREGCVPDEDDTAFYISNIRQQIEDVEAANKDLAAGRQDAITEKCEAEAQAVVDQHEKEFTDKVADWEPLSWKLGEPRDPGDQDGAVGYQTGVGDSPLSSKVGA